MKRTTGLFLIAAAFVLFSLQVSARENIGQSGIRKTMPSGVSTLAQACDPPTAQTDLDVNNVRTRILAGGDMWWNLATPKYEIPKGSLKHSLYSGALWIGGIDAGGQLKVAAMTYRQTGVDFWPGPLNVSDASVSFDVCKQYDKHFAISRQEVDEFAALRTTPGYVIPRSIIEWPGNGTAGQDLQMAPYFDANGDGEYKPEDGDYPDYNVTGAAGCNSRLFGDKTLWWVFNDKGNIHSETQAQAIGLEIRAQAFGFSTNDEINNMTFYNYEIINRSSFTLNNTYFGQWVDADLGYAFDDYVGCDVGRGLGYCYNGNAIDGSGAVDQYGANPPAVGVDFFQGPKADANDGIDNDRDGVTDEPGELIIMSKFVYYNNDFSVTGNPQTANHYYNYLSGFWKDGSPFTYGGNAYQQAGPNCDFMFPGDSDPLGLGTGGAPQAPWDEASVGNVPQDRRFMQSAGPFTLTPGAVNQITTGVVWARASQGGNLASIPLLKLADDKAQALFDNCFKVLNGPKAPNLDIKEFDRELVFRLINDTLGNNKFETYSELDPLIIDSVGQAVPYDKTYEFEGYIIYQVKDASVSSTDLDNPDKARILKQMDVKNGVGNIVNYTYDPTVDAIVPKSMVTGADEGIVHSFNVTEDLFATANRQLVNHKTYYYMAVAYGYNEYKKYKQDTPPSGNAPAFDGQKQPFKAGRQNIRVYTAIPHNVSPQKGGTVLNSGYASGPKITRIEGQGNGGFDLELTSETVNRILNSADGRVVDPQYVGGRGPIDVKVIDPLALKAGTYDLKLDGVSSTSNWTLSYQNGQTTVVDTSDKTIQVANEQLFPDWGISVTVKQVIDPGKPGADKNGFLNSSITFADETKKWLTGVQDQEGSFALSWIRSGNTTIPTSDQCFDEFNDYVGLDDNQDFEKVVGGTWAPYRLTGFNDPATNCAPGAPAWHKFNNLTKLEELASVNVVITSDKSKWTRVPVLETCDEVSLAEGGARKLDLRKAPSVDKNFKSASQGASTGGGENDADYISATGMSWFPGYAINMETGERLNMAFGENSFLIGENGRDMQWNPTSSNAIFGSQSIQPLFGGMHNIYVFGHNGDGANRMPRYDKGAWMRGKLNGTPSDVDKRAVFTDAMWVNIPLLADGRKLMETDATIRLRVNKSYKKGYSTTAGTDLSASPQNANNPMYRFSTDDILAEINNNESAVNALDLIRVVPNPYYASSSYERSQLDNRVKITNLPEKCVVSIYTLNGTLVRRYKKEDPISFVDWDLKNTAGVPIAGGMYIIHVEVEGVGEKIVKWFGVLRPIDLDSF